jgi:hypothetical protein
MRRFVRRPSPAMIVALIALVAATAGNAIADQVTAAVSALKANSVTSGSVKNGSLLVKDFKKSELKKLTGKAGKTGAAGAAGAAGPQGPAGTPNGYTKTDADAAFLGKTATSADSDKLDGIDSSGFVQGGGVQDDSYVSLNASGSSDPFLKIPGLGHLTAGCSAGTAPSVTYVNDSGGTTNYHSSRFSSGGNVFQDNTLADAGTFSSGTADGLWVLQIQKGSLFAGSSRATVAISLGVLAGKCRIQAQLQGSSSSGFILNLPPVILLP